MKHTPPTLPRRLISRFADPKTFWVIMALFIAQSAWIAFSGRYPMAFDEDFHLGIIKLFTHHISPFWGAQPAGADAFGAVVRDPSYLYQWLMSFPYRLISLLTDSQTIQVLFLRAINIGIFAGALVLYRDLLLKVKASRGVVHLALLVFILIPVLPLLAAQINYDSLFMVATAGMLLLTVRLDQELTNYKRINVKILFSLLSVGLLGCLVKFAYLPVFAAVLIFLAYRFWRVYGSFRKFVLNLGFGATLMTRSTQVLLVIMLVVSLGLFGERYGFNMVRYHQPVPDCDAVLSIEQCSNYGPWIRDYNFEQNKATDPTVEKNSFVNFTVDWFYGMWLRSFFAVDGPATLFETRGPLFMPAVGAIVWGVLSLVIVLTQFKKVWRRYDSHVLALCAAVTLLYVAALYMQEHKAFVHTGHSVAINGRYLFPILPPLLLLAFVSWKEYLRNSTAQVVLASLMIVSLLWGGGTLTYILRSSDRWYWPGNNPVKSANHTLQHTLGPITPGYRTPTQFLGNN